MKITKSTCYIAFTCMELVIVSTFLVFLDIEPQFLTEEFQLDKILPSKADSKLLIQNIATLTVRILCSHVPFFKQLDEVFVPHIQHDHSKEMAQMSEVVCLD